MTDTTLVELSRRRQRASLPGALARRLVLARLEGLAQGHLVLHEGPERLRFGNAAEPAIEVRVHDPAFYAEIAFGGSVGAGEAYMLGHWSAHDLTGLLRLLLRNREAMDSLEGGLARLGAPLRTAAHWLHRNTREGSRRNISAHYDIGNDFFELFLDPTMMYSCAVYER